MLLSYVLFVIFSNRHYGSAFPINPSTKSPNEDSSGSRPWVVGVLSSILAVDSSSESQPHRTHANIVWSCIVTAVLCSWTSIHPNVPPHGRTRRLFRAVRTMFWTIVAPELVLGWAVRQWFAAKEIRDVYNNNRPRDQTWTLAHGHFVGMGGLVLIDPPNKKLGPFNQVLTLERLRELLQDRSFSLPVLSAADIDDRSKSDGLLKFITVVQTTWFVLHCIARSVQGLALTELELLTLTLAGLNGLTFLCWWNKPLSIREPVKIYLASSAETIADPLLGRDTWNYEFNVRVTVTEITVKSVAALTEAVTFILRFFRGPFEHRSRLAILGSLCVIPFLLFFIFTFPVYIACAFGIVTLLRVVKTRKVPKPQEGDPIATRALLNLVRFRHNITFRIRRYFAMWLEIVFPPPGITNLFPWFFLPLFFLLLVIFLVVLSPLFATFFITSFIFTAVFGIVTTNSIPRNSIYLPCFYAARTNSDRYSRMVVFVLFGAIFGSIQCIAWHFTYPTDAERTLWRATALALTVLPFVAAPIDWALENRREKMMRFLQVALELILTALLLFYVLARLSLILQAYVLLRKQPPDAFLDVDWTTYIPHIF